MMQESANAMPYQWVVHRGGRGNRVAVDAALLGAGRIGQTTPSCAPKIDSDILVRLAKYQLQGGRGLSSLTSSVCAMGSQWSNVIVRLQMHTSDDATL